MSGIHISIEHALSRKEALKRTSQLIDELKKEHADKISDVREQWNDSVGTFRFTVSGYTVSGVIRVFDKYIELDGELPFVAIFFKGKIESLIRTRAEKLLRN